MVAKLLSRAAIGIVFAACYIQDIFHKIRLACRNPAPGDIWIHK